jgi:hypothetical protein
MTVRAKFKLESIQDFGNHKLYNFRAVSDDGTEENARFNKYSPSGELKIMVDNPAVSFEVTECYYLDFTHAPKQ